jgi:hypothetical protein
MKRPKPLQISNLKFKNNSSVDLNSPMSPDGRKTQKFKTKTQRIRDLVEA